MSAAPNMQPVHDPRRSPAPVAEGGRQGRSHAIVWAKRLLPLGALLLLGAVALWPRLDRDTEQERITLRSVSNTSAGGAHMLDPRYRSVDQKGRPFTITAETGLQTGSERVNLDKPKGDIAAENGLWIMVQALRGVYMQHDGQLDLAGDALLYRSDGTTVASDTATVDIKTGTVASVDQTHAEGPFGALDAQGFAMLDRGEQIQFTGPARLKLNGGEASSAAAAPDLKAPLPAAPPAPPNLSASHSKTGRP